MPLVEKFVKFGQNTPLTCVYVSGGEDNDTASDGIVTTSGAAYATSSPSPHQNGGNGSTRYRNITGSNGFDLHQAFPTLIEFVVTTAMYTTALSEQRIDLYIGPAAAAQCSWFIPSTATTLAAYRGTGTLLGTSGAGFIPSDQWNWLHLWTRVHATTGHMIARVGSWANVALNLTGIDTRNNATFGYVDQVRMSHPAGAAGTTKYDELLVWARSLYWSGGSGTVPVAGATITGGTSGATAIVSHVYNDGAGTGVFFVHTVTGAFTDTETISSGGWSAGSDNALSDNEDELWVPELYAFNGTPSGDVAPGLTNSTGAAHYTEVADSSTATFVSTSTVGQTDAYDTSVTLPPGATIYAVASKMYARLNGVSASDAIIVGMNDGAAAIDLVNESALSGAYENHMAIASHNPNTGVQFTTTEIGNMQLRVTSN